MMTKSFLGLLACATAAFAQSIVIAAPTNFSTVVQGQSFTVEVARPNTLTPSEDVSVAIGLIACEAVGGGGCPLIDPTQTLGTILFKGDYTPTHHPGTPPGQIEFYQNFTVTVPSGFTTGVALLNVAHFDLIGAGPTPTLEVKSAQINVDASS